VREPDPTHLTDIRYQDEIVVPVGRGAPTFVDAVDASAVLRWHSSHANIKLRDVATFITQVISGPLTPEETPNQRISRLLLRRE
jgi:hypothetical protein